MPAVSRPNRPRKVRVQGHDWPIYWHDEESWYNASNPEDADGISDHQEQAIHMRATRRACESGIKDNLLHEILHVVMHTNRAHEHIPLDDRDATEEYVVATTAPLLRQVMRENRAVMTYLLS